MVILKKRKKKRKNATLGRGIKVNDFFKLAQGKRLSL